jgi:6-phosphogluconate dehydrogenase
MPLPSWGAPPAKTSLGAHGGIIALLMSEASTPAARHIGLVGLGVMGRNLALNIDRNGFTVSVHDRSTAAIDRCVASHPSNPHDGFAGFADMQAFVASLARPRRVWVMVNAGPPVDDVIERLLPWLDDGDVVIDGGNSFYRDTQRRVDALAARGVHFVGAGVSGGEEGALKGPAIMPGGTEHSWLALKPILEAIAAKVDGQPCVAPIGPGGAGHFVKMVHNGIEYADMQLIGEVYALMAAAGLSNVAMADVFSRWNAGPLQSYLIEITAPILRQRDERSGASLVDMIQDRAEQKGTGQWAVVSAAERGVVASAMAAAVDARVLSSMKSDRVAASQVLHGPAPRVDVDASAWVDLLHDALLASKIVSYAQGLALMRAQGQQLGFDLRLAAIARIWRGGCIIRARFLGQVAMAYEANPSLPNLMIDPGFADALNRAQGPWRQVVAQAITAGVPVPAMTAALGYFDTYRRARGPANLLQAQRDFFGAHTYERIDAPAGQKFHTDWPSVAAFG